MTDHRCRARRAARDRQQLLRHRSRSRDRAAHLPEDARVVQPRPGRRADRDRDRARTRRAVGRRRDGEPTSPTATAGTTPSARARWARATSDVVDPELRVRGVEQPAGHGLLGAPGDGRREPQRPDDGDGLARRRPDPRRSVSDDLAERLAARREPAGDRTAADSLRDGGRRARRGHVGVVVRPRRAGRSRRVRSRRPARADRSPAANLPSFHAPDLRAPHRTRRRTTPDRATGATYCRPSTRSTSGGS